MPIATVRTTWGAHMIGRFLLAAVLAGAFVPGIGSAADATGTGLTVSDVTVVEPNYPDSSTLVPVDITLDQPATAPVSVTWYAFNPPDTSWDNRTIEYADGTLTFAPGETTKTITVKVLRRRATYQDTTFTVRAVESTSTTGWQDAGTGTVINSDRAGTWYCSGVALHGGTTVSTQWPLPGYDQEIYGGTGWTDCNGVGWPPVAGEAPDPVQLGDYTVTVSAGQAGVDRGDQPPADDTRPFVGDGATVNSSVSSIAITGPGVDVRIDAAWATAATHCEALDALPSLRSASGVRGVVINGISVGDTTEPASYQLAPGLVLGLNTTYDDTTHAGRSAVTVATSTASNGHEYLRVGFARAGFVDNPCTT